MMRNERLTIIPWLLALALLGCTAINGCVKSSGEKMQPIDAVGLAKFVDQHPGKVVLIDFWATWCPPCVQLFPHTVELHKRWADRGLVVAAVSLDDPSDESVVRRFLAEKGADFPNFISRFGASAQSAEAFDITGSSIPYLRIYDRHGKLYKTLGGDKPVDPKEIDQILEEVLSR
ncbi:MAG: TlpA disulfide reductase family protein [Thermoguttaceae bacterium]|jgi:thiol-disulfide isomerase/thioredoxin